MASRRKAEEMIANGEVTVNGKLVTELGAKADPARDHIKVRGKLINPKSSRPKRYFLVNKPRGYISTASDPLGRPLVAHILPPSYRRGIHPVGRLDFNTEGLIVLTNDGDLTRVITEAGKIDKVYHVKVKGSPSDEAIERLRQGIKVNGSRTAPAQVALMQKTKEAGNSWFEVKLRQGKNQQIRKMFDAIGHSVVKLRRVRIGHLDDEGLAVGHYRELKPGEVARFFQPEPKAKPRKRPSRVAKNAAAKSAADKARAKS